MFTTYGMDTKSKCDPLKVKLPIGFRAVGKRVFTWEPLVIWMKMVTMSYQAVEYHIALQMEIVF